MSVPPKFFVEISETPKRATIVADGKAIPVPKMSEARRFEFLEPLVAPDLRQEMKVIDQSIVAGTVVAKGTVVELTLVPFGSIPVQVFELPHADLAQYQVADIALADAFDNPQVRDILVKRDRPEDVTDEERAIVTAAFARTFDIQITDDDPERSYARAHSTARNALAFKV